jgi:outer membrane protein assembly factor BamB
VKHHVRVAPLALLVSVCVVAIVAKVARRNPRAQPATTSVVTIDARDDAGARSIAQAASSGAAVATPIRMQHGDRKRTARYAVRGPDALKQKWKTSGLGAIEAQPIPSPDEQTIYVASLGGELIALARSDGSVKWRVPLGGRSYATPCVDAKGNVYSASDAKKLFAVKPDGKIGWTLDLDDEGDTACALADAKNEEGAIVMAAGKTLYAVTPNGDVAWRFSARGKIFTAPAIDDRGRVFFGAQDHRAYGVDHGKKAFAVDLGADVDGSPAIDDDGTVVLGTDGGEVVRLTGDGSAVWSSRVYGYVRGPLSIARGGDVLAGVYGPRSRVVRLDGKTGAEKASFSVPGTGALEFGVHGAPLEDSAGQLYFGAQDDLFRAIAPAGNVVFTLRTEGDVDAPGTLLSDGALVVASDDGAVYYLEPSSR